AGQVFNSIRFDETGAKLTSQPAFTGVDPDGTLSHFTCSNWTTNLAGSTAAYEAMLGASDGGPERWMTGQSNSCDNDYPIICMGKARTLPVPRVARSGKTIWQSTTYAVGTMTPDAQCQADRPTGVAAGVALINFTNRAASAILSPSAMYIRPDGTEVGIG